MPPNIMMCIMGSIDICIIAFGMISNVTSYKGLKDISS